MRFECAFGVGSEECSGIGKTFFVCGKGIFKGDGEGFLGRGVCEGWRVEEWEESEIGEESNCGVHAEDKDNDEDEDEDEE